MTGSQTRGSGWNRRTMLGGMALATTGSAVAWWKPQEAPVVRRYVTPEQFGAIGDGKADDADAFRRACRHCAVTGQDLRLARRRYRGARVEVHGSFDVFGEGGTIDYLGIGNTLIGGTGQGRSAVATAWPAIDLDAYADKFPVRQFSLARSAKSGATILHLHHTSGLRTGDTLFLAQQPTSMSSKINFIPNDFTFAEVRSVSNYQVMLTEPLQLPFETGAGVFSTLGTARNCKISDLTIITDSDAYQHVLRSGIDITLDNITFAGESAVGACTFSNRVTYRDCRALRSYGPLSVARGCDQVVIDGFDFTTRYDRNSAEPFAIFLEESFQNVRIQRMRGNGAGLSIRMADMAQASVPGRVLIDECEFRTDNAVRGSTSPFQGGVAIGLAIEITRTSFTGSAHVPDPGMFPGIKPLALTWMASTGSKDRLSFRNCVFKSTNGGVAFARGTGFQGALALDPQNNRFIGCSLPV